jgi:replicative DNA helicase
MTNQTTHNGQATSARMPPHNRDAERALLACMLRDNLMIPEILLLIRAEEFYGFGHQKIFTAIAHLANEGKAADVVTVAQELARSKLMDEIGGPGYLADLWDASPSAANYRQYATLIRDAAARRALIHAADEISQMAYDGGQPASEILDASERAVLEISDANVTTDTVDLQTALNESYVRLDARADRERGGQRHGVPTGMIDLDALLCGFQRGELVILAARPSLGKTAAGLGFAAHAAIDEGIPSLFVSLEQSRSELADRLLCAYARVDSFKMRRGSMSVEEQTRLMEAGAAMAKAPLWLDDGPVQNMLRISANARRMKARKGIEVVFIDYLQLIDPENTRANRQEQVSGISRRLKGLARELQIPVVAMAQLNRGVEDRSSNRPKLSDLRESGAIEQDADTVLMLHRVEEQADMNKIEVIVNKQRNGPCGHVELWYVKRYMKFENAAI